MQLSSMSFMNIDSAQSTLARLRIRLLQVVLTTLIASSFVYSIEIYQRLGTLAGRGILAPLTTVLMIGLLIVVSRGQLLKVSAFVTVGYLMLVGSLVFWVFDDVGLLYVFLSIALITSSLLSNRGIFILYLVISLGLTAVVSLIAGLQAETVTLGIGAGAIRFMLGMFPLAIGIMSRYIFSQLETAATQAQRAASLLAASADIGRSVSEMLDLNELLNRASKIIRERFAFYHVSIFLVDTDFKYAHLTASTGDVGERMLARGHRLPIDASSVVGRTAQARDIIVSRDTQADASHSYNELLPFTRSELGMPIIEGDTVIGVVDIQSRLADAFTPTEIDALRVITNQLATAIRNARLLEEKERSIRENKRLFIEAETNLREIQRLNRQLTRQSWMDYLRTDRRIDGVTLSEDMFDNAADWSDEMISASLRRRPITEDINGKRKIAVPIELRGEVVGAIEVEADANTRQDDMVDLVRTVSQRLAVSLDNARLFEESNEATAQEQRVSEIVSQYQAADSVDELLRVTLEGLAETLGAEEASIRLGVVPDVGTNDAQPSSATGD